MDSTLSTSFDVIKTVPVDVGYKDFKWNTCKNCPETALVSSDNQHCIAVRVEPIPLLDGVIVGGYVTRPAWLSLICLIPADTIEVVLGADENLSL